MMFCKKLILYATVLNKLKNTKPVSSYRCFHIRQTRYKDERVDANKAIMKRDVFDDISDKNRNTYLEMVQIFVNQDKIYRRGHVEFIYAALKHMKEFGVHRDLEAYKTLIDILPKGKFVAQNILQAEFMHYPKQQQCVIDLLEQMEENGVMPDYDMEDLLLNIFGKRGYPLRRFWRMMYWMPKFKNLSPWPLPDNVPDDTFELAKLAIERISSVDVQTKVTVYQAVDIKDSIDDTWIISAQSPDQQRLLSENALDSPVYVEGYFKVWLRGMPINYFMLRGKARPFVDEVPDLDDVSSIKAPLFGVKPPENTLLKKLPSVHEQEDGVVYSVCATGSSSKDSLLSWIRHLENNGNPILANVPIVFTLRSGPTELTGAEADIGEDRRIDKKNEE